MAKNLQNILVVALSTMGSRVLGLLRDILTSGSLGLTYISSAFLTAFTLPNLFRRLLGEGALTSALIPVISDTLEAEGREGAFRFVNQVLSGLLILLLALMFLGMGVCHRAARWVEGGGVAQFNDSPEMIAQWQLGMELAVLLMPYLVFICISAFFAAVLNVLDRFAIPALSPIWLNLAMIAALGFAAFQWGAEEPLVTARLLCWGVLLGGFLQMLIPMVALLKEGWRPKPLFCWDERSKAFCRLLVPGVFGASVIQLNALISRLFAFGLNTTAVGALFFANRLVELPLGVFTIAVTTVMFPRLARLASAGKFSEMGVLYGQGIRLVFAISFPAALGLMVLHESILASLFEWGVFDQSAVSITSPLLVVFAIGLPFYSLSTFATRGFHTLKDIKTPVRIAWVCLGINVILSYVLMQWLETLGLAIANVVASVVQSLLLHIQLNRKEPHFRIASLGKALLTIGAAGLGMALLAWCLQGVVYQSVGVGKIGDLSVVGLAIPASALVYFGLLWLFRFEDREALADLFLRRFAKKKEKV